jgi:adenylate cyclase
MQDMMVDDNPDLQAASEAIREDGRVEGLGPLGRLADVARRANNSELLLDRVRRVRRVLPGDEAFGDPLSVDGYRSPEVAGRWLVELGQPGLVRETGLAALQVWQSATRRTGTPRPATIVFTDLVGFSSWALGAGDGATLELLRLVSAAIEPPVNERGGHVVKRMGGMMAVIDSPDLAVEALVVGGERLTGIEVGGYRPRMRAGMHSGVPQRIGGDYLGVDVNIAARVAQRAGAGEILVSGETWERLDKERFDGKRKWSLRRIKGAPDELAMWSVVPRR